MHFEREIEIESKVENIRLIENIVDELSDELKINQELYGNLLIAAIEATNNAIVHGNKQDSKKKVFIKFEKEDDQINLYVADQGPGFDYNNIPDPTAPENIEKVSGRGIFLMNRLSDQIEFTNEGRNVKLSFNL